MRTNLKSEILGCTGDIRVYSAMSTERCVQIWSFPRR